MSQDEQFRRRLSKAGWHAYLDEETGRMVTNAYVHEVGKLEAICKLQCEVVCPPLQEGTCAKIGPKLGAQ